MEDGKIYGSENRRKLYENLSKDGFDLGTIEDFNRNMDNKDTRQAIYKAAKGAGWELPEYSQFDHDMTVRRMIIGGKRQEVDHATYDDFLQRHPSGSNKKAKQPKQPDFSAPGTPWGTAGSATGQGRAYKPFTTGQVRETGDAGATHFGVPYKPDTQMTAAQRDEVMRQNDFTARQIRREEEEERKRNQPLVDTGSPEANRTIIKTQGEWDDDLKKGASRISNSVVVPAVDKAISEFEKKAHEVFEGTREDANGGGLPTGTASGATIFGSIKESNKAKDPEKILDYLKQQMEGLYNDQSFIDEIGKEADRMGIDRGEYLEQVIKPQIMSDLSSRFDNAMIARELPKSGKEYVVNGLGDSIVGMLADTFLKTKSQRAYKNQASAMTENGQNPYYNPGTGAKLAKIGVTFAADAPFFGVSGKVGGMAAKNLAERQIKNLLAKGLSENAARSIVGTALENSVGARMKNYIMQHVVSSSITLGGFNAMSEGTRQIRDDEFDPGALAGSTVEGLATGAAFGLTGGTVQALSQPLSGIAKVGAKVVGFGAEAETMYATEELAKMAQGEEGFENPFEGSVESLMKLGVMKVSSPGGLVKGLGEIAHPVKSSQRQRTGIDFTEDEQNYIRSSAEGKSLVEALSGMHPELAASEVNGKKSLTPEGEQMRRRLSDSYNAFMSNPEYPATLKQKVAHMLGGVYRPGLETGADIIHNADGSVLLKTRDKGGNCIRDIKFDSFSDAEQWRETCEDEFRLNDAANMWNGTTEEKRLDAVDEVAYMFGLSRDAAAKMVTSALDAKDTSLDRDQYNAIFGAIERNAYPSDEYNPKQRYQEGRKMTVEERHFALVDSQLAEERLALLGEDFAEEVRGAAQYADEKMAELAVRKDVSKEQIEAARDYYNATAKLSGMMDEALRGIDEQVEAANAQIQRNTHPDSGALIEATYDGKGYYVTAGHIRITPEGEIESTDGTGTVILRDKNTGEIEVTNPQRLTVTAINDPKRLIDANESMEGLRGQLMKQADDSMELAPGTPETPQEMGETFMGANGKTYMVTGEPDELGNVVWEKLELDENGDPVGEPQPLDIDEYRKAKSDEIDVANRAGEEELGVDLEEAANKQPTEPDMPEQEQAASPLERELERRLKSDNNSVKNIPQSGILDNAGGEAGAKNGAGADNPPATAPVSSSRIPVDEKGRQLFEQAKPEDTLAELTEQLGEESVQQFVATMASNTAKAYEELSQKDTSKMTDANDLLKHSKELAEAGRKAKYWADLITFDEEKRSAAEQEPVAQEAQPPVEPEIPVEPEKPIAPQATVEPEKPVEPEKAPTHHPANERPTGPTAEQKIAKGTVKSNIGKRFDFQNQDGTRSEVVIKAFKGDDIVEVTRQDYDAQGTPSGEPYSQELSMVDVGNSIVNGYMKPVKPVEERLREAYKGKMGMQNVIDVLTDEEQRRMLDAVERKDQEALREMTSEFLESHREDMILNERDKRNASVNQIMEGSGSREDKLRRVRKQYQGYDDAVLALSDEAMQPTTLEEYVADLHSRQPKSGEGPIAYFSYDRDGTKVVGMQDETGYGTKTGGDTKGFAPWLAPKGKGMSLQKYAEQIHGQLPESIQQQYSDQDVRNTILEVFGGAERPSDITTMVIKRGIIQAEQAARKMEEMWIEGGPAFHKVSVDDNSFAGRLARGKQQTNTEPTEKQKEAGNYKKGHVSFGGYDFVIENPEGSMRRGRDADGNAWEQQMNNTYGYILGKKGKDGDHLDMFINDNADLDNWNGKVYVVDQANADGSFDESKIMYGFGSEAEARKAYLSNYEEGWQGLGRITGVDKDTFDKWLDSSTRQMKPFAEHSIPKGALKQEIQGLEGYSKEDILGMVRADIETKLEEAGVEGIEIKGMDIHGSRMRGDARSDSDIDIVVEYVGRMSEDGLFNILNEEPLSIEGVTVDINPITEGKSGTLEQYMERSRTYDEELAKHHSPSPAERETVLMGAVVEKMKEAGIDVSTDWEEGQRVLDEYNGSHELKPMGQKTNKKKAQVAADLEGKELTPEQQAVVDVYSGKKDNQSFVVSRDDGDHRIIMRQGNESHAGTKHSLFRHYGTNVGTVSSDELLLIPEIAGNGELTPKQEGKRRLMVYKSVKDGVEYTLLTEKKEGKEVFNDFYSNRKASSPASFNTPEGARSTRDDASKDRQSRSSTPSEEARASDTDNALSGAKVRQNSEIDKESEEKIKHQKVEQPVFVSNALKAVEGIRQEKATAEQWLAMIQKAGGLKAGEDKWLGLSDWLTQRKTAGHGGSVTKQELLDFIRENQVQIEESHYVEGMPEEAREKLNQFNHEFEELIWEGEKATQSIYTSDWVDWAYNQMVERYGDDFRSAFDLGEGTGSNTRLTPSLNWNDELSGEAKYYLGMGEYGDANTINSTRLEYTTEGLENKREIALTVPTIEPYNEHDEVHFGDAGGGRAVAWVRFGDTTDADGKRVLVIDEIQSKRHQDGRERGYRTKDTVEEEERLGEAVNKAQDAYDDYTRKMGDKYNGAYEDIYSEMTDAERAEADRLEQEVYAASEKLQNHVVSDVPDAPFEKNWHELAMKRMLRYAAENGYDKIAWTTGEQQAERYNIGNVVEKIISYDYPAVADPDGRNTRKIEVRLKDGETMTMRVDQNGKVIEGRSNTEGKNLTDVVGKDLARRIMEGEGKDGTIFDADRDLPAKVIEGDGLRIGGEGMKGFYDEMLPRFMDKYGKKWGVKTGEVTLPGIGGRDTTTDGTTMHSVDVTPEMKESVMAGQPMFFRTPDGHAYGFTYRGKIYVDPRIATAETPIHEYGHLWAEMKRHASPEEWNEIKGVMLSDKLVQPIIDRVRLEYPELAKEGREDDFVEEIITQFSGKRGAERLREIAQEIAAENGGVFGKAEAVTAMQRLKNILNRFWEGVAKMMGWKYTNANQIADRIMADMLNGVNPVEETRKSGGEGKVRPQKEDADARHKESQLDIISRTNPMTDDYHTGIRSVDDIRTFEEAYEEGRKASEEGGWDEYASYPDITNELIEDARKSGKITIYSSYPIKDGTFVTPSMMQARDYAGEGRVYSKRVPLEDVAWINLDEGQYAKVGKLRPQKEVVEARSEEVIADLSEPDRSDAAADASKPQVPDENGRELINAEAQTSSSGGKETKKSDTLQENGEKNAKILREGEAATIALNGTRNLTPKQMRSRQAFAERQWRRAHEQADEWVKRLRLSDDVTVVDSIDELEGSDKFQARKRNAKGWYDPETGKIVIVMGNHRSPTDVVKTILHEGVAHHGLRKLFGENFDTFLDNAYSSSNESIRQEIDEIAKQYNGDTNKATEEYLGRLAEDTDFEDAEKKPWVKHWFNQIKEAFLNMLKELGLPGYDKYFVSLSDNELRYILWRSYKNLSEPGRYRNVFDVEHDKVAKEVKMPVPQHIEDHIPKMVRNHDDEVTIEKKVSEMMLAEAQAAYKRIDDSMRDENGLDLDEQFEANKQSYMKKNGLNGIGQFVASDLQRAMNKYGSGMVELRWALQDRILDLGGSYAREGNELFRDGDEPKYQLESHPEPEMTPEERQYWMKWDADMKKWKERNAIAADADGPGAKPQFRQGESALDFAKRLVAHNREKALWQTAPKLEDYRQKRLDKDIIETAREQVRMFPGSQLAKMRLAAAEFQQVRHAMSRQKAYDKATVKAVTDFAQDFMKMGFGDHLSRGEMERMLSSVKNATGAKDIRQSLDNIMNILTDNYLRNLDQQVQKLSSVKELRQTAQGVEAQGRLELKGQRMIQAFREAREGRMDAKKIRERLYKVAEKMARNDDEAPMWEQDYEGLSIALQYQENIEASRDEYAELDREYKDAVKDYKGSGRSYKAQQQLLESLEQAMMENKIERIGMFGDIIGRLQGNISESMQGAREFVERDKERVKKIQQLANFDLAGKPADAFREKVKGKPANFFLQPLGTFEQMLKQFGGRNANGEGYLYDYFMRNWMDATDKAYLGEKKAKEELDEKARELFGSGKAAAHGEGKVKRWSDLYDVVRSLPAMDVEMLDGNEKKTFKLNQGNLLYIYMADKMTDGRMKLRKMGISEEDAQAIKEFLDPRLVELGDWLQDDYLVKKRVEYNKVHERMFGAPMAAIDHYFPLKILDDARVQEQDVANMADQDAVLPSTITGNIIKRRKNALPLDILHTDALSLAIEHVEDMERWAATAEWNKDINTLLSYTTFRNKVKNMKTIYGSGDALWNNFVDAARMAAGTYRPKAKPGSVDAAISNIAKGVTAAKISFRVYTAFKQLLSAPAFLHDVNLADFAKYSIMPYGSWKWAMENMPVFEKRWKSRQVGDTRLMDDPTDWKLWKTNIVQMANRMGMSPNALVDGVTCAVGARAIYESRYRKYKKIGATDEVARKRALQDAEIGYNLTQQSSEGAFVSRIQKDRTIAANMLSVFRNSSMAYTRQWVDAARNLKHRTQKGYKEDSISFMTKQMQQQFGLTEGQAQKAAEAEYARAGRRDVARMLNMMFGVTVAWNLGASLPYLLMGDDDKTKKEMLTDAMLRGLIAGPTEGSAAGNLFSEFISRSFASEETRKVFRNEGWGSSVNAALKQGGDYEVNPLPLMADIQGMIKKMGYDKYAAAQDVFNICMQSAVGVNPQTFTDMWNAIMDYAAPGWDGASYGGDNDMANAKELALFIMRLMNAPTSSWKNKYIDELGMDAEDAKKLSYDEMARRYAHYKHWKDAPIMGWLRGEEGRQAKIEKLQKQFEKAVKERLSRADYEALQHELGSTGDEGMKKVVLSEMKKQVTTLTDKDVLDRQKASENAAERKMLQGEVKKRAKAAVAGIPFEALADSINSTPSLERKNGFISEYAKRQGTQDYYGKSNSNRIYQEMRTFEDVSEDIKLSELYKQVKESGDKKSKKAIDKLRSKITKQKNALGDDEEANEEIMRDIRQWRKEALEIALRAETDAKK